MTQTRVLLRGANGFIGSHILQLFLEKSIFVQAVVRSEAKASKVRIDFPGFDSSKLDFSIVPDITAQGAFDQCLKEAHPLDAIIHTASPFNYSTAKTPSDFIDPAVRGTTEILESTAKYAPQLRRFVITSSFAAIGDPTDLQGNGRVYSSTVWNPVTKEQVPTMDLRLAYWASKTFAKQAAWDFTKTHKPGFELVVLNPPGVYGPLRHSVDSMSDLNTSSALIWKFMTSKKSDRVLEDALHISVDVRVSKMPSRCFHCCPRTYICSLQDLALAHFQATFAAGVGNRRYLVTSGSNGNQEICDILRSKFPELDEKIPLGHPGHHALPEGSFRIDNSASAEVLGTMYRPFEETIADTGRSLLKVEKELSANA